MKKIVVLGGGLVGSTIARDLSGINRVIVLDQHISPRLASFPVSAIAMDCSYNFGEYIKDADLVINALPGFLGYQALKQIIAARKNVVDISFFAEDPFSLQQDAMAAGITAVVDCGVAPGLCNMMLGYVLDELDTIQSYECVVGGLPVKRVMPFQYKAPYSPADVIEFYTRPARIRVGGQNRVVPALSDIALENTEVGTLESFNTDGLRTLLTTMPPHAVRNMRERTYRWPGTAQFINQLRDAGFFVPEFLPFTTQILKKAWQLEPREEEFTLMNVTIKSDEANMRFTVFDQFDGLDSSMARTTGFTCNAIANLILDGTLNHLGIVAPEQIPECFMDVCGYLEERKVSIELTYPSN